MIPLVAFLAGLGAADGGARPPQLVWAGRYESGVAAGTEVLSVQAATLRAVLANSAEGWVDLLDLSRPEYPRRAARHDLALAEGEQLTSVAFHPRGDLFACAIQGSGPWAPGRVELRSAVTGDLLASLATGVGPDCVAIDPTGRFALTADEGEPFSRDRERGAFDSPPGSLTLVRLGEDPTQSSAVRIALSDQTGLAGAVEPTHGRFLEREHEGETFLVPLADGSPALLEPEVVCFAPDGKRAWVTLQEHNAVAVVDVEAGEVERCFGLGLTRHAADTSEDGEVRFDAELVALREPDGIAVTPDGKLLVTADEGDTEPKASKVRDGLPAGGGRTISVFDAASGACLGDTGNQIDELAARHGVYPDDRSDSKGCEPEMVTTFELGGVPYAAASLERAGAVVLVSLADPAAPVVVALAASPHGGTAPEGIAHLRDPATDTHYVLTADEGSGTVSVYRVVELDR